MTKKLVALMNMNVVWCSKLQVPRMMNMTVKNCSLINSKLSF